MGYKFDESLDENGKPQHLHTFNGKDLTGTSSVGNVISKGGLVWWSSGLCASEFGWLNPKKHTPEELEKSAQEGLNRIKGLDIKKYLALLTRAYMAHSKVLKKTAKAGTDLHKELEEFVKGEMGIMEKRDYDDKITPFIHWSDENVEEFLWSEAHCYDEDLWVGGISDTGVKLKNGKLAVIDFKSSKDAYLTQFIQDAGYALQIEKNGLWNHIGTMSKKIEGKFDALIVVPFGAEVVEPKIRYDVEELKQGFMHAVGLYRLTSKENKKY